MLSSSLLVLALVGCTVPQVVPTPGDHGAPALRLDTIWVDFGLVVVVAEGAMTQASANWREFGLEGTDIFRGATKRPAPPIRRRR